MCGAVQGTGKLKPTLAHHAYQCPALRRTVAKPPRALHACVCPYLARVWLPILMCCVCLPPLQEKLAKKDQVKIHGF